MWLLTIFGLYSVVEVASKPGKVKVRARAKADILALIDRLPDPLGGSVEVVHTPTRDYPWRIFLEKNVWADLLRDLGRGIAYRNYKTAALQAGVLEFDLLDAVWQAGRDFHEDEDARDPRGGGR